MLPEARSTIKSAAEGPWTFTVEAGKSLTNTWNVQGRYDLSVFGPNGFLRSFRGGASPDAKANLDIDCRYEADDSAIVLIVMNNGPVRCRVSVVNAYGGDSAADTLRPGQTLYKRFPLAPSYGWYDLSVTADTDPGFLRRLAGHLENGRDSASDPAFGGGVRARGAAEVAG